MSDSLWPRGLQRARPPCPSPTPGACSNSCPSSRRCHPAVSSSVLPSPPAFSLSRHHEHQFTWKQDAALSWSAAAGMSAHVFLFWPCVFRPLSSYTCLITDSLSAFHRQTYHLQLRILVFFLSNPTYLVVQSISRVQPSATSWTAARQASLSITSS